MAFPVEMLEKALDQLNFGESEKGELKASLLKAYQTQFSAPKLEPPSATQTKLTDQFLQCLKNIEGVVLSEPRLIVEELGRYWGGVFFSGRFIGFN